MTVRRRDPIGARFAPHSVPTTGRHVLVDTWESAELRRWLGHQSARYNDLLKTIAHAPRPSARF
jgi:hypothetical protein